MSFGLLVSPAGSAGACRVRVRPERSRRRTGPATDRGLDFHAGNPLSSVLARGQEQDLPGSLATHPVTLRRSTTPDDPLRLAYSGASGAAPTRLTMKASSLHRFRGLPRRFITCCLRFTTSVTARHARLASGWLAAPLPGGSRTRWIATRGFSSWHPPLQGLPWRNKRSRKTPAAHATSRPSWVTPRLSAILDSCTASAKTFPRIVNIPRGGDSDSAQAVLNRVDTPVSKAQNRAYFSFLCSIDQGRSP